MVGFVIVAHGDLPQEMIKTTELIVGGKLEGVSSVSITGIDQPERIRADIEKAIAQVETGDGVVVFTDMFGGTPSNIALSFLKDNKVEVISGVNLPMLVDLIYSRKERGLADLCQNLVDVGRSSIHLASEYLRSE
jgi:mannose PTS system EIIA component